MEMESGDHICKICGDKFSSVRGMNIHMNVHKDRFAPPPEEERLPAQAPPATNVEQSKI
jgi:hypothetical protein